MSTDISALKSAIKLAADAVQAGIKFSQDKSVTDFQPLFGDLLAVLPTVGEIPAEISALSMDDAGALIAALEADLGASGDNLTAIIVAALKLLNDLATVIWPDVKALLAAISPAPVAPAAQ